MVTTPKKCPLGTDKEGGIMNWTTALHEKRQRLVHAMVQARAQGKDRLEQALITIIGQMGEFETEFQKRIQKNQQEHEVIATLADKTRKQWPELWADMAVSLASGCPDIWIEHEYLIIGVQGEHVQRKGKEYISFESRINQLEALPLSQETIKTIDDTIDTMWKQLQPAIEDTRETLTHWEYAARMHLLSKRFLALYSKVQGDAITAVKQAEETGQLTQIDNQEA
jgi:hypothetical protein